MNATKRLVTIGLFSFFVSFAWACDPRDLIINLPAQKVGPADSNPLNVWEKKALSRYTQQDYEWINSDLRTKNMPIEGELLEFVTGIDGALAKIESRVGRSYRGTHLPPKVLDTYLESAIVSDMAYLSTSASAEVVMTKWNPENNGVFIAIDGFSGRDISSYAFIKNEQEVLFPRATQFKVLSRCMADGQAKPYWVIHLKEIAKNE